MKKTNLLLLTLSIAALTASSAGATTQIIRLTNLQQAITPALVSIGGGDDTGGGGPTPPATQSMQAELVGSLATIMGRQELHSVLTPELLTLLNPHTDGGGTDPGDGCTETQALDSVSTAQTLDSSGMQSLMMVSVGGGSGGGIKTIGPKQCKVAATTTTNQSQQGAALKSDAPFEVIELHADSSGGEKGAN